MRATGMAVSHALHGAMFGGTAQFVVTWPIKTTGDPMSAGWYGALACAISVAALLVFRQRRSGDNG